MRDFVAGIALGVGDESALAETAGANCCKSRVAYAVTAVPTGIAHVRAVHLLQTKTSIIDQKIPHRTIAPPFRVNLTNRTRNTAQSVPKRISVADALTVQR